VKNSKHFTKQYLLVLRILSLAGLIFLVLAAKAEVWDANWTNAWASSSMDVTTGWTSIVALH
jgi:APA family basic amino acid/polyamine antiporter